HGVEHVVQFLAHFSIIPTHALVVRKLRNCGVVTAPENLEGGADGLLLGWRETWRLANKRILLPFQAVARDLELAFSVEFVYEGFPSVDSRAVPELHNGMSRQYAILILPVQNVGEPERLVQPASSEEFTASLCDDSEDNSLGFSHSLHVWWLVLHRTSPPSPEHLPYESRRRKVRLHVYRLTRRLTDSHGPKTFFAPPDV